MTRERKFRKLYEIKERSRSRWTYKLQNHIGERPSPSPSPGEGVKTGMVRKRSRSSVVPTNSGTKPNKLH